MSAKRRSKEKLIRSQFERDFNIAWRKQINSDIETSSIKILAETERSLELTASGIDNYDEFSHKLVKPYSSARRNALDLRKQQFRLSFILNSLKDESERKLSAPGSLDSPESLSAIPPVQSPSSSSVDEGSEGSSDDLKTADSLLQESNSRDQILNVADLQEEQNLIPKLTASPSKTKEEISSETGQSCRRKLIVEELCYTEGSYVSALATMIQIYAKPLLARADSSQPLLSKSEVTTIFHGVEDLHKSHVKVYAELKSRLANWRDETCISDIFMSMSPLFSIYLDFVKNYSKALETLRTRRRQNVQFEEFIMDMQSTLKANYKRYGLSDLLIMPIQRIPRYSLLLQALKKSTSRSHPDYQGLTSSIAIVDDIAMQVNEGQRHAENMEEFYNLLQRIKGEEHPEVEGREFVMMDKVVELYDSYKLRRWVYLVLFKDFLLCTKFAKKNGMVKLLWQTPLYMVTCSREGYDVPLDKKAIYSLQSLVAAKQLDLTPALTKKKQLKSASLQKCRKELMEYKEELAKMSCTCLLAIHLSFAKKLKSYLLLFQTDQDCNLWFHRLNECILRVQEGTSSSNFPAPCNLEVPDDSSVVSSFGETVTSGHSHKSSITSFKGLQLYFKTNEKLRSQRKLLFSGFIVISIIQASLAVSWKNTSIAVEAVSLSSGGINEVRRLFQTPTSTSRKPTWGCTSTVELSNCLALRFVCLSEVLDKQEVIVGSSLILTEELSGNVEQNLNLSMQASGTLEVVLLVEQV
ncbi:rac guanine nucleotide exchange factor JJ-like isoform X2 [Zophobas morio]|uniref:rac guanine nucleotide exchange factor JJ-like isoform X2 n=1 Tax=Zophobas morio TaxID=2755281 RepID=UPI003083EC62